MWFTAVKNYSYVPCVDGNWGGLVDAENNIYNGMIGMLQRKVNFLQSHFNCLDNWKSHFIRCIVKSNSPINEARQSLKIWKIGSLIYSPCKNYKYLESWIIFNQSKYGFIINY
jgi:hypothetical protein